MKFSWILFVYLFLLALGGCESLQSGEKIPVPANPQASATDPLAETAERINTQTLPDMPNQENEPQTDPSLPIPSVRDPQALIEIAKEDLARRLSHSGAQISLAEINQVSWPDASLGCPQAGLTYTQTEIPGYLIILEYAGDEFEYHANIHGNIFYCEKPTPPISKTPININP